MTEIKRIRITAFGKLKNFDMSFESGFNEIKEENGFGKTTVAAFIKAMFFGLEGGAKRAVDANARKKYTPWLADGKFGGSLELIHDGKTYIITRFFGKTASGDIFELTDGAGIPCRDYGEDIGEKLLDVSADGFERCLYIPQSGIEVTGEESIKGKLRRLVENTEQGGDYDAAVARLNDYKNRLISPGRTRNLSVKTKAEQELSYARGEMTRALEAGRQAEEIRERIRGNNQEKLRLEENLARLKEKQRQNDELSAEERVRLAEKEKLGRRVEELRARCADFEARGVNVDDGYICGLREKMESLREAGRRDSAAADAEKRLSGLLEEKRSLEERHADVCDEYVNDLVEKNKEAVDAKTKAEVLKAEFDVRRKYGEGHNEAHRSAFMLMALLLPLLLLVGLFLFWNQTTLAVKIGVFILAAASIVGLIFYHKYQKNKKEYWLKKQNDSDELFKKAAVLHSQIAESFARSGITDGNFSVALAELQKMRARYRDILSECEASRAAAAERGCAGRYERELRGVFDAHGIDEADFDKALLALEIARANYRSAKKELEECAAKLAAASESRRADDFSGGIADIEARVAEITRADGRLHERLNVLEREADGVKDAEVTLAALGEKISRAVRGAELADKTAELLTLAKDNLANAFMPGIKENFLKYMSVVTDDKYNDAAVSDEFDIRLVEEGGGHDFGYFSRGTKDVAMFCLRLALIDVMYGDDLPFLLLDDPFVNADEGNFSRAMAVIKERAAKSQVIYFTCCSREVLNMKYKKCPVCDLNYISDEDELCSVCAGKSSSQSVKLGLSNKTSSSVFDPSLTVVVTVEKGVCRGKTGYLAYDEQKRNIGIVYSQDDPRTRRYGKAELSFYEEYENEFGAWRIIKRNGEYLAYETLQSLLDSRGRVTITTDARHR